jgi:hypothetical protein
MDKYFDILFCKSSIVPEKFFFILAEEIPSRKLISFKIFYLDFNLIMFILQDFRYAAYYTYRIIFLIKFKYDNEKETLLFLGFKSQRVA